MNNSYRILNDFYQRYFCMLEYPDLRQLQYRFSLIYDRLHYKHQPGADPGFDQGGPQIVTGLKLPFWGLSFVEFWCWGLIFGGRGGGPGPPGPPPGSAPDQPCSDDTGM